MDAATTHIQVNREQLLIMLECVRTQRALVDAWSELLPAASLAELDAVEHILEDAVDRVTFLEDNQARQQELGGALTIRERLAAKLPTLAVEGRRPW